MTRPLSPAEMYPAGHHDISVRLVTLVTQTRVRILESGAASDLNVVLLHGWAACSYSFRYLLESLPALGVHCIAADLRGFGLSDRPRTQGAYSMDEYLADLGALLDLLAIERAVLVGHSMGGGIALAYALARPDRVSGLGLLCPTGIVPVPFIRLPALMPRAVASFGEGRLVPRWMAGWILRHLAYGDASRVRRRDVDEYWSPTQLPGFAIAARMSAAEFDWEPMGERRLAPLAVPSVVILGRKDRLIRNAHDAAGLIPGAIVRELDAGHVAHEERPDEAHEVVAGLVERVRRNG